MSEIFQEFFDEMNFNVYPLQKEILWNFFKKTKK